MPIGQTSLQFVPVGNVGNAPDPRYATPGYGAVNHSYEIGKFEITAGQYTQFLNSVAAGGDPHNLYSGGMTSGLGCQIQRAGSGTLASPYVYTVAPDRANRPVNFVSWGDAARFNNWLNNGQPNGAQDATTTEDGSYTLIGKNTEADLLQVTRNANARYVIPSRDEWYKAAYFDPQKPGGAGYWEYPTRTNNPPANALLNPDPGNNVNAVIGNYTIGPPYYRTEVGAFTNSSSPYNTFDQGGNVWEWNEAVVPGKSHEHRGGSFGGSNTWTGAFMSSYAILPGEDGGIGFRIAEVPEPASGLMLLIALPLLRRSRGVTPAQRL